jgi:hypothetical protein
MAEDRDGDLGVRGEVVPAVVELRGGGLVTVASLAAASSVVV